MGPHNPSEGSIMEGSSLEQAENRVMPKTMEDITIYVFFLIYMIGM